MQSEINQFNFEKKKNQINVIKLRKNITLRNIYVNFLPMKAVSGSSFTLIKQINYFIKIAFIYLNLKKVEDI